MNDIEMTRRLARKLTQAAEGLVVVGAEEIHLAAALLHRYAQSLESGEVVAPLPETSLKSFLEKLMQS